MVKITCEFCRYCKAKKGKCTVGKTDKTINAKNEICDDFEVYPYVYCKNKFIHIDVCYNNRKVKKKKGCGTCKIGKVVEVIKIMEVVGDDICV